MLKSVERGREVNKRMINKSVPSSHVATAFCLSSPFAIQLLDSGITSEPCGRPCAALVEIEHAHTTQVEFFQHFFTLSVECESLYPVRAGSGIIQVLLTKII